MSTDSVPSALRDLRLVYPVLAIVIWIILSVGPARGQSDSAAAETRWETSLVSSRSYTNPYSNVELAVTYQGPDGEVYHALGFWDGKRTFKLRFRFPRPGLWQWQTSCSDAGDNGLHHQSGRVNVRAYDGSNPLYHHGGLRVSDNRRYLCHDDGTAFLWIGDTPWSAFVQATDAEWQAYLRDRKAKGFSVVQTHAGRGFTRRSQDQAGHSMFLGTGSRLRCNPDYWRGVEQKIHSANEEGLFVMICGVAYPPVTVGGARPDDSAAIRRFAKNLAARLAGDHVAFSPVADDLWSRMADICGTTLKRASRQSLIIAHPRFFLEPALTFHDKPYTDAGGLQTGAGWLYDPYARQPKLPFSAPWAAQAAIRWPLALYGRQPRKPVLNLEGPYDSEGLQTADNRRYAQPYPKRLPRSAGYAAFLSGACGYTYGAGGIWNWGARVSNATAGWKLRTAMEAHSSLEMKYLSAFLSHIDWWRLEPRPELVRNQPEDWTRRMSYAVTDKRDLAVAYLPDNEAIRLDLADLRLPLEVEWFDPAGGIWQRTTGIISNSGIHTLHRPNTGDWVLVLRKSKFNR